MHSAIFSLKKMGVLSLSLIFTLCMFFQINNLEADGWGKTTDSADYDGLTWNGVYADLKGLYFTASIPNYSGAMMQNGSISLSGEGEDEAVYLISTTLESGFKAPKTSKELIQMIQDANPNCSVIEVKNKKLGAKYVVDIIPVEADNTTYWRFLTTKDRLIRMGTTEPKEGLRQYFFENIRIRK